MVSPEGKTGAGIDPSRVTKQAALLKIVPK
jgi:hypothetical protein